MGWVCPSTYYFLRFLTCSGLNHTLCPDHDSIRAIHLHDAYATQVCGGERGKCSDALGEERGIITLPQGCACFLNLKPDTVYIYALYDLYSLSAFILL